MIRVTIEVLPDETRQRRVLGIVDISDTGEGWPLVDFRVEGEWELSSRTRLAAHCTIQHHPNDSVIRLVSNATKGLAEL